MSGRLIFGILIFALIGIGSYLLLSSSHCTIKEQNCTTFIKTEFNKGIDKLYPYLNNYGVFIIAVICFILAVLLIMVMCCTKRQKQQYLPEYTEYVKYEPLGSTEMQDLKK